MAGSPNKRARREKQAAAAAAVLPPLSTSTPKPPSPTIPDAVSSVRANPHARARARETAHVPRVPMQATTRAPMLGNATRAVIDDRAADAVRSLAHAFKPGMRLRLSRLRPTWAAGYLEDCPITVGESLASYYDHIKDEYGGQSYMVEVLAAGDVQVFEGALTVAGPPKEYGKIINRAKWEGRDDDDEPKHRVTTTSSPSTARSPFTLEGIVSVATLVLGALEKRESKQMDSVEKMVEHSRDLVVAALGQREQQQHKTSFASQLAEIVDATTALDKVKKVIAGPQQRVRAERDEDDGMQGVVKEATKAFMGAVASKLVHAPPAAAEQAQPAPRAPQRRAQPRGFIPDSASPRQAPPKN